MRSLSLFAGALLLCGVGFSSVEAVAQLRLNPYPVANPEANFDWKKETYRSQGAPEQLVARAPVVAPMPDEGELMAVPVSRAPVWSVVAGQDVRSTLEQWSKSQGVDFIWDGGVQDFKALKSIDVSGVYEEAVRTLLEQYGGKDVRPVGKVYLANASQNKTLVVSVVR